MYLCLALNQTQDSDQMAANCVQFNDVVVVVAVGRVRLIKCQVIIRTNYNKLLLLFLLLIYSTRLLTCSKYTIFLKISLDSTEFKFIIVNIFIDVYYISIFYYNVFIY